MGCSTTGCGSASRGAKGAEIGSRCLLCRITSLLKHPVLLPQVETIRSNVIGCLNLADVCHSEGIHMTYFGTGCIFHYDDTFPMNSGKGFKESDKPNFTGSYYSYTKVNQQRFPFRFDHDNGHLGQDRRVPLNGCTSGMWEHK